MKVFLRILRTIFGLALLAAFAFCFWRFYQVAPKSFDNPDTAYTLEIIQPEESAPEVKFVPDETPEPDAAPLFTDLTDSSAETESSLDSISDTMTAVDSNLPKVDINSWELLLVNAEHPIDNYAPESLTTLEQQQFDSRIIDAMTSFIQAARAEGLSVYLSSAYRSYEEQQYLFNRKVGQGYAEDVAATIVARPGTSEHQTGLVCDITDRYYELKDKSLENTALFQWMSQHCQEYGFIVRFPADKEDITGIIYEPWHFRYVGVEAATYIMENGLCLEEFVALYQ